MSKTVSVRLPDFLWEAIETRRHIEGRSFSQMQVRLLERALRDEPLVVDAQPRDVVARAVERTPEAAGSLGMASEVGGSLSRPLRNVPAKPEPLVEKFAAGACPMVVPHGVKCKVCGKPH